VHYFFDCVLSLLQLRGRVFDFGVAILASSGLRREQPAPMNIFEIAIGKLVSLLGILRLMIVNAQMPFCIFAESVQSDEFVLFVCGRPMSAPRAFTVRYEMSLFDELHGETKRVFI
jgi:hypothetical protein